MNKNVNSWIEGNGSLRAVFRNIILWEYTSPERSKLQLLRVTEKKNPGPYLLQYAIDRCKAEVQWISLYLPLLAFTAPVLLAFYVALLSHFVQYLYIGMGLILAMGLVFKATYFSQYQEACQFIYLAADGLLPERRLMRSGHFSPTISTVIPPPEPEAKHSPEIWESAKGSIAIVLLNELIQKECGRPNIYKGDTHKALAFYAHITGCQAKNLQGKLKCYKNREAINLSTPNIRATHKKYLDILLDYYGEIEDDILYNQAEDLQSFIERNTANRRK